MKDKLMEYLKNFLTQNEWCYRYTREQARAIFTTICLVENIDADTAECDQILSYVYNAACIIDAKEYIEYDDDSNYDSFKRYMIDLIV